MRCAPLVGWVAVAAAWGCELPEYGFDAQAADASSDGKSGAAGGGGSSAGGTGGGSAAGGQGGSAASASGGSGGITTCVTHADCASPTPKCDPLTSQCVPCLPTEDECQAGYYCAVTTCKPGCKSSSECGAPLACDPVTHKCLGCGSDNDCPLGKLCDTASTECVPGCTASHGCADPANYTCCAGNCSPLGVDPDNCGKCGTQCPMPANGQRVCAGGKCGVQCTVFGTVDCNGEIPDGCEVNVKTDPAHCGNCTTVCGSGQSCVDGTCV